MVVVPYVVNQHEDPVCVRKCIGIQFLEIEQEKERKE